MNLTDNDRAFLDAHHAAAMITLRADGTPHAVRVGVALVDGMLWSSGTHDRLRTGLLRRDPRCTLFVFDPTRRYLTLETIVTILEGPELVSRTTYGPDDEPTLRSAVEAAVDRLRHSGFAPRPSPRICGDCTSGEPMSTIGATC